MVISFSSGMEHWRRRLARLKRTLGMEQRLTLEECYQLIDLAEAIFEHGRMMQAYRGSATPYVIVEIAELAVRFRETPQAIQEALGLLGKMGRAEPFRLRGCRKLRLAGNLRVGNKNEGAA
jgi:hypothetical protein